MWQSMPCTVSPAGCGQPVDLQRLVMRHAELVVAQAGGDVGVGAGVDVGVDAQADRRRAAHGGGHVRQAAQFRFALDVEAPHADGQRLLHLGACLADAREHDLPGLAAGGQHTVEFAARDDVEAAARTRKGLQHRQRRIGLHRIADQVRPAGQGALVGAHGVQHRLLRVHVQRRAETAGQAVQVDAVELQRTVAALQMGRTGQAHRVGPEAAVAAAGRSADPSGHNPLPTRRIAAEGLCTASGDADGRPPLHSMRTSKRFYRP
jgi:hypothetical protein